MNDLEKALMEKMMQGQGQSMSVQDAMPYMISPYELLRQYEMQKYKVLPYMLREGETPQPQFGTAPPYEGDMGMLINPLADPRRRPAGIMSAPDLPPSLPRQGI